jgi:hypothetical protein
MYEERKNDQIVQVKNNSLAKVSNILMLTNKLLQEIDSRNKLPSNDFRIHIPDYFFQKYLTNKLGIQITNCTVEYGEIKNIEEINCGYDHCNISSLNGIEYFTSLIKLNCGGNQLLDLDVSKNISLIYLDCGLNKLTKLDVSQNTALFHLDCDWNQLTELDVSNNTALTRLNCNKNKLKKIDISHNTALSYLNCSINHLTELDISHNTGLTELYCHKNQFKNLDLSNNTALIELERDNF